MLRVRGYDERADSANGLEPSNPMKHEPPKPESDWMRSVVDAHASDLLRYAASILNDVDAAKDAVQETFLKLWHHPPEKLDNLRPWLFRVCRNTALDARRKEGRMNPLEPATAASRAASEANPRSRAETRDNHARVLHFLKDLPSNQQEVVRLKFQNGMSYKEIAGITELSVSNVGYLLHTAIQSLRARCEAAGE